jgi:hypothetical protein
MASSEIIPIAQKFKVQTDNHLLNRRNKKKSIWGFSHSKFNIENPREDFAKTIGNNFIYYIILASLKYNK